MTSVAIHNSVTY